MHKLKSTIRTNPTGFTLLELVVALALSVLLLTAIASAIDMLWRTSEFGKERVKQSQLARAIFRKLEVDLRSLTYINPAESEEAEDLLAEDELLEEDESANETTTISIAGLEDQTVGTEFGIIGGPDWLTITLSEPVDTSQLNPQSSGEDHRHTAAGTGMPLAQSLCSQKVITYFINTGLQSGFSNSSADMQSGFIRRMQPNCYGETEQMFQDQIIAPEVAQLQLRYFDGQQWVTNWDSREFYALPLAIEIRMTLKRHQQPANATRPIASQQAQTTSEEYRYVVAVPMAFTNSLLEEAL